MWETPKDTLPRKPERSLSLESPSGAVPRFLEKGLSTLLTQARLGENRPPIPAGWGQYRRGRIWCQGERNQGGKAHPPAHPPPAGRAH